MLLTFGVFTLSALANAENKDNKADVILNNVSENDDPQPPPPPPTTYSKWTRNAVVATGSDASITLPSIIYTLPAQTQCFATTFVTASGHTYGYYYTGPTSYTTSDMLFIWGGCPNGGQLISSLGCVGRLCFY